MLNISTMPPRVRQVIYYVFAIAGIVFGATEIAIGDPHWLTVAMTVLSFVGASIGVTAGIHTPAGKPVESATVEVQAKSATVESATPIPATSSASAGYVPDSEGVSTLPTPEAPDGSGVIAGVPALDDTPSEVTT